MEPTTSNLSDTSTWLPLDGLAPGFDANKAPHSTVLAGRELVLGEQEKRVSYRFEESTLAWHADGRSGEDGYEAFEVADDLLYVQFHCAHDLFRAVTLVLDLLEGQALSVVSAIGEEVPGQTRVRQDFLPAVIEGMAPGRSAPAPSTALIGKRVLWEYSSMHAYEHIYLSPKWYTWQCLAGPEQGLADTDEHTTYQVRPGIYLFAWREKVIPCASVTIADHRDTRTMRSHGVLFGLDESGQVPTHFTFGSYGRLLSNTVHPTELDPAR